MSAEWRDRAACKDADSSIFDPFSSIETVPSAARQFCQICPVQGACLSEALRNHEIGIWGNTTERQRKKLRRCESRRSCPRCSSGLIVRQRNISPFAICLGCGVSWRVPDSEFS